MCSAAEVWGCGVSNARELPWKRLHAEELLKRARALRHSAADPDGWSGGEICHWPLKAWKLYMPNLFKVGLSEEFSLVHGVR